MDSSQQASSTNHALHGPVTVMNVSEQSTYDAGFMSKDLKKEELSPTPKKMPAKILFRKDDAIKREAGNKIASNSNGPTSISGSMNDEGFHDFLQRVAMVQQQEAYMQAVAHAHSANHSPPSPHRRNSVSNFAMLPEYARYHEARFHRALSRGNSYGNLNNNISPTTSPCMTMSPRVEWVPNPVAVQRAWDEHTLVARHAFPSSIFYSGGSGGHDEPGVPTPVPPMNEFLYPAYPNVNLSDISDGGMSSSDYFRHPRRLYSDAGSGSIPSAAVVSAGSSSSWSDEEEQQHTVGARHFQEYLGGHSSRENSIVRTQQGRRNSGSASASSGTMSTMVEISPGVHEPLRGADETVRAVRQDYYVPISCFGCSNDIFCIADAKYVICPECRVVSPIDEGALDGQALKQHGLGLGFSCASLFQMQSEILSER
jgi:hypothetical protein